MTNRKNAFRGVVNIKVDEDFFEEFEKKRVRTAKKLGLRNISQKDFTKIMVKEGIFNDDGKIFKGKKGKFT